MSRSSVSGTVRKKILQRDNYSCMKCGRTSKLEIHHIFPVIYMSNEMKNNTKYRDNPSFLITLCSMCHKEAPDDPVDFFKYTSKSLSPEFDRSLNITKVIICFLQQNKNKKELLLSDDPEKHKEILNWIDTIYKDLWKIYVTNEINLIGELFENMRK